MRLAAFTLGFVYGLAREIADLICQTMPNHVKEARS